MLPKICEKCGKKIEGKYVEAFGKKYHPEHFLCRLCNEIIEGSFVGVDSVPYHEECYKENLAPRCSWCGEVIEGEGVESEAEKYHIKCYREHIATKCDICGDMLMGKYLTDFWGNNFCEKHINEYPQCPYCSTLIAPSLGKEKKVYEDGRTVCGTCGSKAVKDESLAKEKIRKVSQILSNYGINADLDRTELELISKEKLEKMTKKESRGYTQLKQEKQPIENTEIKINILENLPDFEFMRVSAHELMHVWIYQNTKSETELTGKKEKFAEGSCEYASYLVIKDLDSEYRDLQEELLRLNKEKIYREGFKKIKKFVENKSVENWLEKIKTF